MVDMTAAVVGISGKLIKPAFNIINIVFVTDDAMLGWEVYALPGG